MSEVAEHQAIADDVVVGRGTRIYGYVNLYGCEIGEDTTIGTFVEVQRGACIGSRCKIQSHSFICTGVTIEDEVFVGHGVMFINDMYPQATRADGEIQTADDWVCRPTVIKKSASIGSNATILSGVTIGESALVGAGSVVTKDVPPRTIVAGNPARILRKVEVGDRSTPWAMGIRAGSVAEMDR